MTLTMDETTTTHKGNLPNYGSPARAPLTVAQAARALYVSRSKIYRDISRGVLVAGTTDKGIISLDTLELEWAYDKVITEQEPPIADTRPQTPTFAHDDGASSSGEAKCETVKRPLNCDSSANHDAVHGETDVAETVDDSASPVPTEEWLENVALLRDRDEQIVLLGNELQSLIRRFCSANCSVTGTTRRS